MADRLLAWCFGATLGLVAGALLGDAVRTDAELRAARRTARRLGAAGAQSGGSETPGAGNGPQNGAQGIPEQRTDDPDPHALPSGQECTGRLGVLTCRIKGPHGGHAYASAWAEDRHERTDSEVE